MKNILIGIVIGITSLIPGVSAGTIIYLSKDSNYIYQLIIHFKRNIKNIILLLFGLIISVLSFSKFIEYLFSTIPNETIYFFIGLLIYSLKNTLKQQNKYSILFLLIGATLIFLISFVPSNNSFVVSNYPKLDLLFLFSFTLCGFLDGALTITPGISGSMVMMILGPYYLYKSYLANVTSNIIFFIPLVFYFIGNMIGLFLGSKFSTYMLSHYKLHFSSIIIGMIIASIIILIPHYFSISCFISLLFGYIGSCILKRN